MQTSVTDSAVWMDLDANSHRHLLLFIHSQFFAEPTENNISLNGKICLNKDKKEMFKTA